MPTLMDDDGYLIAERNDGQLVDTQMQNLEKEPRLTIATLIHWSYQVSRGMNFMASKKV